MLNKIQQPACLFLDLGGVLFYDEYVELYFCHHVFKQLKDYDAFFSEESFFKEREKLYPFFKNEWLNVYLDRALPQGMGASIITHSWKETLNQFSDLFRPYPDVLNFLKKLSQSFSLYCVANQPLQVEKILSDLGFFVYFKELFIDTRIGYSKPDACLFQAALQSCQKAPEEVLHIGDRLDNDIIPAKLCGMRAIKLTLPLQPVYLPSISSSFHEQFFRSLRALWHRWEIDSSYDYVTCHSYAEVLRALSR